MKLTKRLKNSLSEGITFLNKKEEMLFWKLKGIDDIMSRYSGNGRTVHDAANIAMTARGAVTIITKSNGFTDKTLAMADRIIAKYKDFARKNKVN